MVEDTQEPHERKNLNVGIRNIDEKGGSTSSESPHDAVPMEKLRVMPLDSYRTDNKSVKGSEVLERYTK